MYDRTLIRNYSIIAHIDHGKSTLADRMLEITKTIEKRKMREQLLDQMELERERGITIKMQPVRMIYTLNAIPYILNLIDTPGHIDFSYEVSRALTAVEGAVLLVDATQGVEAQTLSTLETARGYGLTIIPAVSKIDSPLARVSETAVEIGALLNVSSDTVLHVSGKTGEGVSDLLDRILVHVPPPKRNEKEGTQALVFDFSYSDHRGVILYLRVFDGELRKGDRVRLIAAGEEFVTLEVGTFAPSYKAAEALCAGEIGYVVTGIKKPGIGSVGDTLTGVRAPREALPGYMSPAPVVWASVYPESADDFDMLRHALARLRLLDAAFSFEEEASGVLGRGFRCGFLGMLHLEIILERLKREFGVALVATTPTASFVVEKQNGSREIVYTPTKFPDHGDVSRVEEPWVKGSLIAPGNYVGELLKLLYQHEAEVGETELFAGDRTRTWFLMPLRELYRNFFDQIKSATSGYASLSYESAGVREAHVTRLDVLVAGESVPAFSRVVSRARLAEEAEAVVERLHKILPRQLFSAKIQAQALGRIIASRTLSAYRKDVTGYLYGGDVTRKKKLLEKQKKGKKKMKEHGIVHIPHEAFLAMIRRE